VAVPSSSKRCHRFKTVDACSNTCHVWRVHGRATRCKQHHRRARARRRRDSVMAYPDSGMHAVTSSPPDPGCDPILPYYYLPGPQRCKLNLYTTILYPPSDRSASHVQAGSHWLGLQVRYDVVNGNSHCHWLALSLSPMQAFDRRRARRVQTDETDECNDEQLDCVRRIGSLVPVCMRRIYPYICDAFQEGRKRLHYMTSYRILRISGTRSQARHDGQIDI
jgi:hypothetical protein